MPGVVIGAVRLFTLIKSFEFRSHGTVDVGDIHT